LAEKTACLKIIRQSADKGPVTLLYAARDKDRNYAAALRELMGNESEEA
jgi:uncharacterized protein YeaO (DUF488 family)